MRAPRGRGWRVCGGRGRPRRAGARTRFNLAWWRRQLLCFLRRGETPTQSLAKRRGAGATPRRRRCRRLPVRNAGRGGTARGWEDGLNGVGAPRGEGDAGSQSRAGVRRRPRVKKPGRHRAREESYCVVRSRRLRNPRAGGVGAGAAWRPRATRARSRRIAGQSLPPPRQGSGRDRGLRGGCNKSEASGIFWLCCNGSDPNVAFLARLRSRLSRKNSSCVRCRLDTSIRSLLGLDDLIFYFKNHIF